jgi:enoyl-CoA hydratase/carnithine racemase
MRNIPRENSFESTSDFLETLIDQMVGVIKIKGNVFEMATNLPLKEVFFGKIRQAYNIPEIKVLLILNGESTLGEDNFIQFEKSTNKTSDAEIKLVREENALIQFIRLMHGSDKIVISGVRGTVVSTFLGAILSADYRIASENCSFSFLDLKCERFTQGALGFYLPRYVGMLKAKKILLNYDALPAGKALELGLVDDIVSDDNFENGCIAIAKKLSQVSPGVVTLIKCLLKSDIGELDAYLKRESGLRK